MTGWAALALGLATWLFFPPLPGRPAGRRRAATEQVAVFELAGVAELLALVLRSGAAVAEAMELVAGQLTGPLQAQLRTLVAAARWGMPAERAWAELPQAWSPLARALQMSERAGIAPAQMLTRAAAEVRRAERHRLKLATARLGVRVVLPLGLAFLPAFALITVVPVIIALAGDVLHQ